MILPFALATAIASADACNHPATTVTGVSPQWPDPRLSVGPQSALVVVRIAADGTLDQADVIVSTGYELLDSAALSAARASKYAAAAAKCLPVPSKGIFRADFHPTSRAPITDPMTMPRFTPDAGWQSIPESETNLDLAFAGRILGTWGRGDERLSLAEYVTINPDINARDAFASVESGLELFVPYQAQVANDKPLCGGSLPAEETRLRFGEAGNETHQADLFVAAANGKIYTVVYTVPSDMPFNTATLTAISGMCV